MLELLQIEQPVNAMNDVSFTLGDLLTIGGGAIVTISTFIKLQYDQKSEAKATVVRFETSEKEQKMTITGLEEKIIHITNGKRAMKKDLIGMIEKESIVTKNRIDSTQHDMKEHQKSNQAEFKEINGKLNEIIGYVKNK